MPLLELEGTWEEIRAHDELVGQRVRVTVIGPQMPRMVNGKREPNYAAIEAFRKAEEFERNINPKPGANSVSLVHVARDGAMYDYEPSTAARQPRYTPQEVQDRLRAMSPEPWVDPASLSIADKMEILRKADELTKDIKHIAKPGLDGVTLVREARGGAMYDYEPCE